MSEPYYSDDLVTLYHGDCREITAWLEADVLVTDPPYGETSIGWDRWPDWMPGFVAANAPRVRQLWCFGSTRMFLSHVGDFVDWKLAQDIVWSKPRGRGTTSDRFNRSHELALHWYRGPWRSLPLTPPTRPHTGAPHRGATGRPRPDDGSKVRGASAARSYQESGSRLILTVIPGDPGDPRTTLHPTQKPLEVLEPIIRYSCPDSGTIADPFAGSGSTMLAARRMGRKVIGVELEERYCEVAANRLAQHELFTL